MSSTNPLLTKSFTGTGSSSYIAINGPAVLNIYGSGAGTITVERLASDGTSAVPMTKSDGTLFSVAKATGDILSFDIPPGKADDQMRITCSAYTSGTIKTEIAQ